MSDAAGQAGVALCAACGVDLAVGAGPCPSCGQDPLLDGRYRLLERIGGGAVGTTYRAERVADGRVVAIKELLVRRLDGFETERLFRREARTLAELSHPGVPALVEELVAGHGRQLGFYLVLEHIAGRTLAAEQAAARYDEDAVLAILDELLGVLVYLHGLRPPVVHRDIKLANVMRRDADRSLVLIDFGAVKEAASSPDGGATVAGTFGYMPPEQLAGRATPASDLYALGALAVALLAGQAPEDLLDDGNRLRWEPAVTASPPLRRLLRALLAPEVARRLADAATARELVRAIRCGGDADALDLPGGSGDAALLSSDAPPPPPRALPARFLGRVAPGLAFKRTVGLAAGGLGLAALGGLLPALAASGIEAGALGVTALFGAVFGGVGAVFVVTGLRQARRLARVYRDGEATTGRITAVAVDDSLDVNGRRPYAVDYIYRAGDAERRGRDTRWDAPGAPGDPVQVLYGDGDGASLIVPIGLPRDR